MAEPFLSEIRIMSFGYAPRGWALCNGQLLPINQNQALFSLLGTTYGGNGQTNFALPDLRGKTPIHVGQGNLLGQQGGEQAHTLSISELPTHTHVLNGTSTLRHANLHFADIEPGYNEPRYDSERRRQPGALKYATLSDLEFLYRSSGNLPQSKLRSRTHGTTICR
jgi:hypothetical protein